ncbi:MAG: hypothetical protein KBA64_14825 [Armatimonadetes bacterium]|nr:hypothetical protein [Armatimonadota bacterium]
MPFAAVGLENVYLVIGEADRVLQGVDAPVMMALDRAPTMSREGQLCQQHHCVVGEYVP